MWAWENPGAQCGARQSTGKTQASCALSAEGRPHSSTSPGDAARRIRCLLSALHRDDETDISKGFCGRRAPTAGMGRTISEGGRDPRLSRLMPEMTRSRSPGRGGESPVRWPPRTQRCPRSPAEEARVCSGGSHLRPTGLSLLGTPRPFPGTLRLASLLVPSSASHPRPEPT